MWGFLSNLPCSLGSGEFHLMKRRRFGRLDDICRYANGWAIQGALFSLFWQFFEFRWFLTCFALGFSHTFLF
jgi:hypothetical protein